MGACYKLILSYIFNIFKNKLKYSNSFYKIYKLHTIIII